MTYFHKNLTQEKWNDSSRDMQILNIGSELMRARKWIINKNEEYKIESLNRAFELIDLTADDEKWRRSHLKEILRFR
ncbi:MAG: hypothetical protein ABIG60_03330 [Patescibacteria group bacterium]